MSQQFGYTTGTYAAAAAKGALECLLERRPVGAGASAGSVLLTLPKGERAELPLVEVSRSGDEGSCAVVKQSVEEADVTHGMRIEARVRLREDDEVVIDGGPGIGRVTKPGLSIEPGEAAINPVPRQMISAAMRECTSVGVDVEISAPDGERIASETTNARLGIIGGISIIGTRGIMYPKSLKSYKLTIKQRFDFFRANSINNIFITPGNIGEEALLGGYPDRISEDSIVQCGDYPGFTMKLARRAKIKYILAGHPGKLAKFLNNDFQTHYTQAPAANDAVIARWESELSEEEVAELREFPTVEGICNYIRERGRPELIDNMADGIAAAAARFMGASSLPLVLLFDMKKELIGCSREASSWRK